MITVYPKNQIDACSLYIGENPTEFSWLVGAYVENNPEMKPYIIDPYYDPIVTKDSLITTFCTPTKENNGNPMGGLCVDMLVSSLPIDFISSKPSLNGYYILLTSRGLVATATEDVLFFLFGTREFENIFDIYIDGALPPFNTIYNALELKTPSMNCISLYFS